MGIYHLQRPVNGTWSAPTPVSQNPCNAGSADVELVVSQGNHLHAVWYDRQECELGFVGPSGRGEVFYSDFFSDAPHIAPHPLPPAPTTTPIPEPTGISSISISTIVPSPTPTAWRESGVYPEDRPRGPGASFPLVVGIGLPLVLIVVVVVVYKSRLDRR